MLKFDIQFRLFFNFPNIYQSRISLCIYKLDVIAVPHSLFFPSFLLKHVGAGSYWH